MIENNGFRTMIDLAIDFAERIEEQGMVYEFTEKPNDGGLYRLEFWHKGKDIKQGYVVTAVTMRKLYERGLEIMKSYGKPSDSII